MKTPTATSDGGITEKDLGNFKESYDLQGLLFGTVRLLAM